MFNKTVLDALTITLAVIELVVSIGILIAGTLLTPTEVLTAGVLLVNALLLIVYVPEW